MPANSPIANAYLPQNMLGDPALCVSATAVARINAPPHDVFDWFVDLDISRVLNGYGPLPSVIQTYDQTGPWNLPGQRRKLEMSGGIRATQEILACASPDFFAYRVTGFTHILDLLSHGAEARWWFFGLQDGSTELRWTYTFWPRSFVGKLGIYPVIKTIWARYMDATILEMKHLAEQEIVPD
jgi:hypothetical protein